MPKTHDPLNNLTEHEQQASNKILEILSKQLEKHNYDTQASALDELANITTLTNDPIMTETLLQSLGAHLILTKRLLQAEAYLNWIRNKLPPDAPMFGNNCIAGQLHVICSNDHSLRMYINTHKCADKQGIIARQDNLISYLISKLEKEEDKQEAQRRLNAIMPPEEQPE